MSERLDGRRILVVDDNEDSRILLAKNLKRSGANVDLAIGGKEAVAFAFANPCDAILMDMMMPGFSGYDATRALREQGYKKPIIAVTANAMMGEREHCLAIGCSAYITKPINWQLLLKAMLDQFAVSED